MKGAAILGLVGFIAAQVVQQVVARTSPADPADAFGAAAWLVSSPQMARHWMILLSMFGLLISYVAICENQRRQHQRWAAIALAFLALFCAFEIAYRSVDVLVVRGQWARAALAETDPARVSTLLGRVEAFDDVVEGWYFPLLMSHLLGSGFLLMTARRGRRGDGWLAAAAALNVARLSGRIAAGYLGATAVAPFNGRLYFPLISLVMIGLLLHCFRTDWGPSRTAE